MSAPDMFGEAADQMAILIAQLNQMLEPIIEASQGYMLRCKELGFDTASASRMGADYHGVLTEILKNQAFGAKK